MASNDQIKDEKVQYDINRYWYDINFDMISKFNKYEYLTGEEILPSEQNRIIENSKLTHSPLGKDLEKQTKTTEDQGEQ